MGEVWLVVVPIECECPIAAVPVNVRSVWASEAAAEREVARINRIDGRRAEAVQAFALREEVRDG